MGLWRIVDGFYGPEELWVPERGHPGEWPEAADSPPCEICTGRLTRRKYEYTGKDDARYSGYRYVIAHYGQRHALNPARTDKRTTERRRSA